MGIYIKEQETLLLFTGIFLGAVRGLSLDHTTDWQGENRDSIRELIVNDNRESGDDDFRLGYIIRFTPQKILILSVADDKQLFEFDKDYSETWNDDTRSCPAHQWRDASHRFDTQHGSYYMDRLIDEFRRLVKDNRARVAPLIAMEDNEYFELDQKQKDKE